MNGICKSVKEIGKEYGISRIMLQIYERIGLIHHTCRNKYGYLLYSEEMVGRILLVRHLQKCGFELPEIKRLTGLSRENVKAELIRRIDDLRSEELEIEMLIGKTRRIIEAIDDSDERKITKIIQGERQ